MLRTLKQILVLLLLVAFGYLLYLSAMKAQDTLLRTFHVSNDSTVKFIGTVSSNDSACLNNVSIPECVITAQVSQDIVMIVYNTGNGQCGNKEAIKNGLFAKKGDEIKVYGFYKKVDNENVVYLCPTNAYYLNTLSSQP